MEIFRMQIHLLVRTKPALFHHFTGSRSSLITTNTTAVNPCRRKPIGKVGEPAERQETVTARHSADLKTQDRIDSIQQFVS
jgi:hypothetical protein